MRPSIPATTGYESSSSLTSHELSPTRYPISSITPLGRSDDEGPSWIYEENEPGWADDACNRSVIVVSVMRAVCCVLRAACCVLCAVCCVLRAVCCVLCAVCCVPCVVCCVLCAVCCVLCAVCCVLSAVG